jgi:type IV secretory pathway VirJ component
MRRALFILPILLLLSWSSVLGAEEEAVAFGRFGHITLYRQSPRPSQVVLFVSGDGGWNLGVIDMARGLSSLDALVVGIDITSYLKRLAGSGDKCSYCAADFESLSKFVQKKLDFPRYVQPVLVGYSSGATLVYATLVQAPPNTFVGAISLGFCPDLPLTKPLCRGNGLEWKPGPRGRGYVFLPATNLQPPWIAFQGAIDQVCHAAATEAYVKQVKNGEIVLLPKVGHGFTVQRNWMPQFKETFTRLVTRKKAEKAISVAALTDLPIVEVSASGSVSDLMAVIISGDGGWAGIDREVADVLAGKGIPVVGLNSLAYFWTKRTPDNSARDLERILDHYLSRWKKEKAILLGYSLGADVLPFMASRLPKELLGRVSLIALLNPARQVDFEFHLTDWLGGPSEGKTYPLRPEVQKLVGTRLLCLYGEEEKDSLCRDLEPPLAKVVALRGAHHFGGNYYAIAETILNEVKAPKDSLE